jgi:putative DNA-invertase from lambdoid prophage Rac
VDSAGSAVDVSRRKPAGIYVRVSTLEQAADGDSLAAQTARLGAYCGMRGLAREAEFVEQGVSASKPLARRPQGKLLLAAIKARAITDVVVWSLDRAFRNTAECLTTIEAWTARGITLHLCNFGGQAIDTSSAVGKLFLTVVAGVAEFERNVNGERTALAMRHKISKREYVGGEARYGWRVVGRDLAVPGSGHLVQDDHDQAVIARARALRAGGLGSRRIATTFAGEGIVSRRGGGFAPVQIERMWCE